MNIPSKIHVTRFKHNNGDKKDNPIYITGRGLVYISDEVMKIGDIILDESSKKYYRITGIEQRRVMMDPPKLIPPYGYRITYIRELIYESEEEKK